MLYSRKEVCRKTGMTYEALKFYCNQGLVLFLFNILASIVSVIPFIGWLVGIVASVAGVIFWVLGIVNAINGRAKTLPLIGKITLLK